MIGAFINEIRPATVRTLFVRHVPGVCGQIGDWISRQHPTRRMAACHLAPLRPLRSQIDSTLRELAEVARAVWPRWYGRDLSGFAQSTDLSADACADLLGPDRPATRRGEVSVTWLRAATVAIALGQLPLSQDIPRGRQIHQLALAIEPDNLLFVLSTQGAAEDDLLLGFAKLAEWLARHTQCPVCAVVPSHWREAAALSSISYGAAGCDEREVRGHRRSGREQKQRVWPLLGRPHPFSPGEQRLAQQLGKSPTLSSLFQFNVWATTRFDNRYLVDMLWSAGKVVVEVDGYHTHAPRETFSADRHRDYELVSSGYLVLRLTHDEVMTDVQAAVEKIRNVVQLRQLPPYSDGA